ncbi:hypothetical protein FOWG_18178 [Fusarium oxysporum f. sp. lycopersici MN25]|nr:hypothetical protein FOWG_18178 [Fusarium oxysporum f. sp. lycopersici MN25]
MLRSMSLLLLSPSGIRWILPWVLPSVLLSRLPFWLLPSWSLLAGSLVMK